MARGIGAWCIDSFTGVYRSFRGVDIYSRTFNVAVGLCVASDGAPVDWGIDHSMRDVKCVESLSRARTRAWRLISFAFAFGLFELSDVSAGFGRGRPVVRLRVAGILQKSMEKWDIVCRNFFGSF